MFDDIKKELSSIKVLTLLLTIAVSIYLLQFLLGFLQNFSDIIAIFVFGWLLSFILEPFVDLIGKYLKLPRVLATAIVFLLAGVLMVLAAFVFVPDVINQFNTLSKVIPQFLKNSPPAFQHGVDGFINSLNNVIGYIPSLAQMFINLITVLILSFYLVVEKQSINRKVFAITPKKWHESMSFVQKVVDDTFASFVRLQFIWGLVGGLTTWIILSIFGVKYIASTSLLAGILAAVPVVGPIITGIPPLLVSLIDKPNQALLIFALLVIIEQFIFNVLGPKIISKAFNINPVIVVFALLIGVKVAGATGAIFAVPVISILLVVGREFYGHYFGEKEG